MFVECGLHMGPTGGSLASSPFFVFTPALHIQAYAYGCSTPTQMMKCVSYMVIMLLCFYVRDASRADKTCMLYECAAGNMWGLLERTVAVECLGTTAGEFKKSKADLQGLLPASEYSALETFFSRTVEAAGRPSSYTGLILL